MGYFWSLFLVVLTKLFSCKESENSELFKELISRFKTIHPLYYHLKLEH